MDLVGVGDRSLAHVAAADVRRGLTVDRLPPDQQRHRARVGAVGRHHDRTWQLQSALLQGVAPLPRGGRGLGLWTVAAFANDELAVKGMPVAGLVEPADIHDYVLALWTDGPIRRSHCSGGLVKRVVDRFGARPVLLVHGGAAPALLARLPEARHVPALVLDGLARWAASPR